MRKAKKDPVKYEKASKDMIELVQSIASKHHDHLDGYKIAVIAKSRAAKAKGRTVLATVSLLSSRLKLLLKDDYSFVICISAAQWNMVSQQQKEALIDHILCHCWVMGEKPAIRHHDYEEFAEIIKRHGFWRQDPAEKAIQMSLGKTDIQVGKIGDAPADGKDAEKEDLIEKAKAIILETGRAATSVIQRRLRLGFQAAAEIMDELEKRGVVGPTRGSEPREILIQRPAGESNGAGSIPPVPAGQPESSSKGKGKSRAA